MKTKLAVILGSKGKFLRNPVKSISILIALVMVIFIVKCVSVALTDVFSFDGGMNAQVAQNLAGKFAYATNYDSVLFDQSIQTGLPVILPVAILFMIFGESFAAGLIVNAIYLILLAFAIKYYLKNCLKLNKFLILLAVILLYGTHDLFKFGFGLYGEVPMAFYLVLMLIYFHKYEDVSNLKFLFMAGLFLGLGFLTKTVILICIPAILFAAIFDFMIKQRFTQGIWSGMKRLFKEYGMFVAGFLGPVLIFEIYKLVSLGVGGYLSWWKGQGVGILLQAGVKKGFSDTNGIYNKFTTHLGLLSSFTCISEVVITFLLLVVLLAFLAILIYGIFLFWRKRVPGDYEKTLFLKDLLILITVSLSYFGWWLLITPTEKAWYRRIFAGCILLEICLVLIVFLLMKYRLKLAFGQGKIPNILNSLVTVGFIGFFLQGLA